MIIQAQLGVGWYVNDLRRSGMISYEVCYVFHMFKMQNNVENYMMEFYSCGLGKMKKSQLSGRKGPDNDNETITSEFCDATNKMNSAEY